MKTSAKAPTRIGKFHLLELLDQTATTERLLCKTSLSAVPQMVAIKRLRGRGSAELGRALLDEAKVAALLSHPSIPALFDVGNADGGSFLVYEPVRGTDLHRLIMASVQRSGRVLLEVALHIVINAASALHHAHGATDLDGKAMALVHRHISTETILVTDEGHVMLMGFGSPSADEGMLSYRSPEQVRRGAIDRRSDLFSLGIVLYELIGGRRLFFGIDDAQTRDKLLNQPIARPSSLWPACPPELDRVIMRALARDCADRYQTAEDLQLDLEALARQLQLTTSSVRTRNYLREVFGTGGTGANATNAAGSKSPLAQLLAKPKMPAKSSTGDMPAFEIPADAVLSDVAAPPPPPRRTATRT